MGCNCKSDWSKGRREVSDSDIARWEFENRLDILDHTFVRRGFPNIRFEGDVCPFLSEDDCLIEDTKPEYCKEYD
jgi:Fe-S-cluster containining protein